MTTRRKDPLLDTVLDGKFRVEALLGRGGNGAVYKVAQIKAKNRHVALKILELPKTIGPDEQEVLIARFHREAEAMGRLNHPNTVSMYAFGDDEETGLLWLSMELLKGEDLKSFIEREAPIAPGRAVKIAEQVCRSLDDAHEKKIIHRDLKPGNVFLCEYGSYTDWVKVLDFGIARLLDQDSSVTSTGMATGTPKYMAPEQCRAGGKISPVTDMYALGCMLFELITGAPPFNDGSIAELLVAQISSVIPRVEAPGLTEHECRVWSQAMLKLLSKRPRGRPQSALEMVQFLEDTLARAAAPPPAGVEEEEETLAAAELPRVPAVVAGGDGSDVEEASEPSGPGDDGTAESFAAARDPEDPDSGADVEPWLALDVKAVDATGATISSRAAEQPSHEPQPREAPDQSAHEPSEASPESTGPLAMSDPEVSIGLSPSSSAAITPGPSPTSSSGGRNRRTWLLRMVAIVALVGGVAYAMVAVFGPSGEPAANDDLASHSVPDLAEAREALNESYGKNWTLVPPPASCATNEKEAVMALRAAVPMLKPGREGKKRAKQALDQMESSVPITGAQPNAEIAFFKALASHRAERKPEESIALASQAADLCDDWVTPVVFKGWVRMGEGRGGYKEARSLFERGLDFKNLTKELKDDLSVRLALVQKNDHKKVIELTSGVIDVLPRTPSKGKALLLRGTANQNLRRWEQAQSDLEKAAKEEEILGKPDEVRALWALSEVFDKLKQPEQATRQCRRALEKARTHRLRELEKMAAQRCPDTDGGGGGAPSKLEPHR
jgi:serine/threonine protein kinase/tetratricopeptide (TPR) repeat protein